MGDETLYIGEATVRRPEPEGAGNFVTRAQLLKNVKPVFWRGMAVALLLLAAAIYTLEAFSLPAWLIKVAIAVQVVISLAGLLVIVSVLFEINATISWRLFHFSLIPEWWKDGTVPDNSGPEPMAYLQETIQDWLRRNPAFDQDSFTLVRLLDGAVAKSRLYADLDKERMFIRRAQATWSSGRSITPEKWLRLPYTDEVRREVEDATRAQLAALDTDLQRRWAAVKAGLDELADFRARIDRAAAQPA